MQIDNDERRKRTNSSSAREITQFSLRSFLRSVHFRYIVIPSIILSLVTIASIVAPTSWVVSDADHFYFEIFATVLSAIVAFYCITRAYTLNEKFSLYVGVGFSTIAVIDLLHAIFSYMAVGDTQFLSYFIPQTWFAGRTFLGAMLVIAVAKYAPKVDKQDNWRTKGEETKPQRGSVLTDKLNLQDYDIQYEERRSSSNNNNDNNDENNNDENNNDENIRTDNEDKNDAEDTNKLHAEESEEKLHRSLLLSLVILAFLAVSAVLLSFITMFPGIVISQAIARPYENPSLILFSIALFLFYKKRLYSTNDAFYKGILGALIIDVFGQIIMSFSSANFHTAHNVAHMLKNSGYFVIILSLAVSSIQYNKIAKQKEATIRLQYNKLKEMDRMKDEFINVAAHELRTPIQPIIGLSEILRSRIRSKDGENTSTSNAENQEFVDVILRNGQRLEKLVEDVLDVAKIESQSLELRKERFDLNELITSIIDDIMAAEAESMVYGLPARRRGKNNVKITYQPQKQLLVYADRNRISQVISNLLNNALKFTAEGHITINTEKNKDRNSRDVVIVSICDTGSGVDPEIMPRLFNKFSSKSFSGTGLGLYICKNIIEAHGGWIWAENNKGAKGATFSFTLPIVN